MAKNKKNKFNYTNLKINDEELSITKIGEIVPENQNPIFIFVIVGILLIFIFFLPNIVNLINDKGELPNSSVNKGPNSNEDKEENPENKNNEYYELSESLKVNLEENIVVDNFNVSGKILSFNIINNSNNKFNLGKDNYFLEVYNKDNMLLERIILNNIVVLKDAFYEFKYELLDNTASNIKKITFVKKDIADYPSIVLEKNDSGDELLTCTNKDEILTYKFLNNRLLSITDNFKYANENINYQNVYSIWKSNVDNLNNIEGITAMFVDTGNSFVANIVMDLENVNNNLNNIYYYNYQTEAKIVKFEMEARGFSCK